ncbi:MFS transporter [Arthrobacter sp. zg-Y826]|uniref:MFS transporter n=1 Tax=Arthrobacter jinronghuae TaxID=2964609 RepID=UPI0021036221|nr:MFS transporter [Arthrobacter jinronghuae]MCQ1955633.1 MFS transporter [Arthrobacter jinronghuae]
MQKDHPVVPASSVPQPVPLLDDAAKISFKQYAVDFLKAPGRAKAALIGSLLLVAVSPAALAAMTPFIVPAYAMSTGTRPQDGILLFVSIPLLVGPLFLPFLGRWVDRHGARTVALPSIILYAVFMALVPVAGTTTWLLGVLLTLTAICGFSASLGVVFKVISGWFPAHRGIGFGLVGVTSGVIAAISSPLFQWLINGNAAPQTGGVPPAGEAPAGAEPPADSGSGGLVPPGDAGGAPMPSVDAGVFAGLGWDGTYLVTAIAVAVIGIPTVLWLISEPKGTAHVPLPKAVDASLPGVPFRKAILTRPWILLILFLVLAGTGPIAMRQNAVDFFGQSGVNPAAVSVSLSVLASTSIIGLLAGGTTLDRTRRPWVVALLLLGAPLGLLLALGNGGSLVLVYLSMGLLGIIAGVESALGPALIAKYFGMKSFAALQGMTLAVTGVALAASPYLFSALQAATGSYAAPMLVLVVLGVIAVACAALLPKFPAPWTGPAVHDEETLVEPRPTD